MEWLGPNCTICFTYFEKGLCSVFFEYANEDTVHGKKLSDLNISSFLFGITQISQESG